MFNPQPPTRKTNSGTGKTYIDIPIGLRQSVKVAAALRNISMTRFICLALEYALDNLEEPS